MEISFNFNHRSFEVKGFEISRLKLMEFEIELFKQTHWLNKQRSKCTKCSNHQVSQFMWWLVLYDNALWNTEVMDKKLQILDIGVSSIWNAEIFPKETELFHLLGGFELMMFNSIVELVIKIKLCLNNEIRNW